MHHEVVFAPGKRSMVVFAGRQRVQENVWQDLFELVSRASKRNPTAMGAPHGILHEGASFDKDEGVLDEFALGQLVVNTTLAHLMSGDKPKTPVDTPSSRSLSSISLSLTFLSLSFRAKCSKIDRPRSQVRGDMH